MSSHDTLSPTGGVTVGHSVESANPDENLLERIPSRENLLQAWKRVKANKGADGVDGMSIKAFPDYTRDHWEEIRDSLFAGTYQPSPVHRVEIPKATGGRAGDAKRSTLSQAYPQAPGQPGKEPGGAYRSSYLPWLHLPRGQHPLDRQSLPGIQASCQGAHMPKLVRLNGLPVPEARTVSARLGELLRDRRLLYRPISGTDHWIRRRVRMCYWKQWRQPRTKVRELFRLGTSLSASISVAMNRKRTLTPGSHPRYPDRYNQQVAQGSGAFVCQRAVGQHPLPGSGLVDSVNRPVRTRMRGGVGAGGEKPPATRLGLLLVKYRVKHSRSTIPDRRFLGILRPL